MKKIINFRSFLITAVFVICSVLCGYLFYLNNLAIIPFILLLITAIALCLIFRKDYYKVITFILAIITSVISFVSLSIGLYSYKDERIAEATSISGRIISLTDNGKKSVIVDELSMDGINIDGKMIVNFNDNASEGVEYLRYGDVITLKSDNVIFNEIIDDGEFLSYYFIEDYRYTVYTGLNALSVELGEMNFIENIHFNVRKTLVDAIGDYGNIAYGVLTGNKNFIDTDIREEYSVSGLAHILAVSGLHIGFLVSLISLVLKLCKVKKLQSLIITSIILILYNVFIGGAVSAIRATIMTLALLYARCIGARSDSLNNLSLAVTVILTFLPQSIFDAGFLMSVGAVFGVVVIYPSIYKIVTKKLNSRLLKGFVSVLLISLSAQIGITPTSISTFNTVSPYSVLANVIVIPILGVAYVYLLVATLVSVCIPAFSIILYPVKLFFMLIGLINNFIYEIPYSQIVVYGTVAVFVIYSLVFVASRFVMMPQKFVSIIVAIVLSITILSVENISKAENNTIAYSGSKWDVTSIVCVQNETLIVGDMYSKAVLEDIKELKIRKIDKVFLTRLNSYNVSLVIDLYKTYRVDAVYVNMTEVDNSVIFDLLDANVNIVDAQSQNVVNSIYDEGVFYGYALSLNGRNVLHLKGSVSPEEINDNYFALFDYVRCVNNYEYDWGVSLSNYEPESSNYVRKRVVSVG